MNRNEYIKTIKIKDKNGKIRKIKVGLDDYGQCYFFEYKDDNGDIREVGCGTYNEDYMSEIYGYFGVLDENENR